MELEARNRVVGSAEAKDWPAEMTPLAREGQTAQIPIATGAIWRMSLEIAFEATDGTPEIRDAVNEHLANLEQHFGPLHACRVVIKGPGAGDDRDRYRVIVHLALAESLEVKVGPPPRPDARYKDLTFAISDTFRRARRRLQDRRRRMDRQSKRPESQSGPVADPERGEVVSAGMPPGVLSSAGTATADVQPPNTSLCRLQLETDIGSTDVVPAEGSHGRPEPKGAPGQPRDALAETESAEPDSATSAIVDPALGEGLEAEPIQPSRALPIVHDADTAEHSGPERRGSLAFTTITIFNPLGFLTVLSGLLQAMIVTSTNVSNAALRFLQIFFGSTLLTKPSAVEKRAQTGDATEGLSTTVNPSRPPPQK